MPAVLTIHLFAHFRAERDGVPLPGLHLREGERLLAYLALRCGEPVSSRELAKRFWPGEARMSPEGEGDFPSVRQALYSLRQALGPDASRLTRPSRSTVCFAVEGIACDVLDFDRMTQALPGETSGAESSPNSPPACEEWADAAHLHRGPLLADWNDGWAVEARTRRQKAYERVLRRLIQHTRTQNDGAGLEAWTRRLLAARPDDEETGRDLLRLLGAAGRHAEAGELVETLADAAKAAKRELAPETLALAAQLRQERERRPVLLSVPALPTPPSLAPAPREPTPEFAALPMEPAGGAIPVESPYYIERGADAELHAALTRCDSVILVKGARQVGKTSLLARGLHQARQAGTRVAVVDFQKINEAQFASPDALYLAFATTIALQLDLEILPRETWNAEYGPNLNLELFLRRHVFRAFPEPFVWCLDEADRLFTCPFGSEVFGLFRSWHNDRALNPAGPWSRLTLAIACATEAHLFITDLNQSPFNVGTRLALEDFTLPQVAELNRRCGGILAEAELERFHALTGGHPYLTRRGLDEARRGVSLERMETEGDRAEGLFSDHLRRLTASLSRSPELIDVLREMLAGRTCAAPEAFYRLRTGGVISGTAPQDARFRCRLYAAHLARQFA